MYADAKYDYSLSHVTALCGQIREAGLSTPLLFWRLAMEARRACYNGIGPAAWSPWFRRAVTWLLEWFEVEALIHDVEYAYAPRTYWAFTIANARFALNALLYALHEGEGVKYVLRQTAFGLALALLCQLFGWRGYKKTEVIKCENLS